MIWLFNIYNYF